MEAALVYIFDLLSTSSAITAKIPAASMYYTFAPLDETGDFLVYSLSRPQYLTKDGLNEYELEINGYMGTGKEAAQLVDTIEAELLTDKKIKSRSAEVSYADDRLQARATINFTFKN